MTNYPPPSNQSQYQQAPQGYGAPQQPGYGYAEPQPKGLSITSLVLGVASVFLGWTFLAPIAGLIVGFMGLKREPTGKGFAITGLVLNGLCLLGWLVSVVIIVLVFGSFWAVFSVTDFT
ncbi:DUF4190 domain-containing protein [Humidisolicoccus flavus]|uniref:DUF4190 domain-containing protein n=1 Tax=Humidisolicoccus flavus TaxID=3111414 RepID=UPI00324E8158